MPYDSKNGMGYGSGGKNSKMKGGGKAKNMTYSGDGSTMPMSNKSYNGYGLSSSKITKRGA